VVKGMSAPRQAAVPSDVSANTQSNISYHRAVPNLRIRQAADLLGVSDDTVRRWINQGTLAVGLDAAGRKVIASEDLAEFSRTNAPAAPPDPLGIGSSARNRFVGLVTRVISDEVMTQVEMQCGPFTVVSLMSTEAAEELKLRPGSVAVAVVKATAVIVETARPSTAIASD
jgi:molybdopterin-binding protein